MTRKSSKVPVRVVTVIVISSLGGLAIMFCIAALAARYLLIIGQ